MWDENVVMKKMKMLFLILAYLNGLHFLDLLPMLDSEGYESLFLMGTRPT